MSAKHIRQFGSPQAMHWFDISWRGTDVPFIVTVDSHSEHVFEVLQNTHLEIVQGIWQVLLAVRV